MLYGIAVGRQYPRQAYRDAARRDMTGVVEATCYVADRMRSLTAMSRLRDVGLKVPPSITPESLGYGSRPVSPQPSLLGFAIPSKST